MAEVSFGHHHVGLSVADLDRARDWYQRALGLHEELRFEVPAEGIRVAMLAGPGDLRIELLERKGSQPLALGDPHRAMLTQGYGHWALRVEDVDTAFAALIAAGARSVWEPRSAPEPGARMAYLTDPDGNLIELVQPPAA